MSKVRLVEVAAKEARISKVAAARAVNAVLGAIVEAVVRSEKLTLVGFGTFKPARRAARTGRNPQTGKELQIAATTVPHFAPSAAFKAAVAQKIGAKKKTR